jgi:oligopeptide/dipeptide ABC transporter ATP-binding protein
MNHMNQGKMTEAKLSIENLKVYFYMDKKLSDYFKKEKKKEVVKALDDVSIDIFENEVLGIVGETGCGKSTLAKTILLMNPINEGKIYFDGIKINDFNKKDLKDYYQKIQMIWQNPFSSLNPRMNLYEILSRPLINLKRIKTNELKNSIGRMIKMVGLNKEDLYKYPHEFSGGGRQRIVIARALITNPSFIIADEPTSSLDVSIQAQILNLLKELKNDFNLTMLFISHDLSIISFISNRVAVMYFGRIVEILPKEELFTNNYHYYTKKLIDSIPKGRRRATGAEIVEKSYRLNNEGCIYYYRCENAKEKCLKEIPVLFELNKKHYVACHYPKS